MNKTHIPQKLKGESHTTEEICDYCNHLLRFHTPNCGIIINPKGDLCCCDAMIEGFEGEDMVDAAIAANEWVAK